MAGLTLEQANLRLKEASSPQDIMNILKDISIDSPGSKTILYSGMNSSDIEKEILNSLKNDSSIRMIDKTVAADFLDYKTNKELKKVTPQRMNLHF